MKSIEQLSATDIDSISDSAAENAVEAVMTVIDAQGFDHEAVKSDVAKVLRRHLKRAGIALAIAGVLALVSSPGAKSAQPTFVQLADDDGRGSGRVTAVLVARENCKKGSRECFPENTQGGFVAWLSSLQLWS